MNAQLPPLPRLSLESVITHAARLLTQSLASVQGKMSLTPAQYRILLELWQQDQLTQQTLVDNLAIEQSTIGNALDRMERDGLILRRPHITDRRSRVICLTKRSQQLKDPAIKAASKINKSVLSDFNEAEQAQLFEFINRIIVKLTPPKKSAKPL